MSNSLQGFVVNVKQGTTLLVLDSQAYAEIDQTYGLVTLWHGQIDEQGNRSYGRPVASMPLDFLTAIAAHLPQGVTA